MGDYEWTTYSNGVSWSANTLNWPMQTISCGGNLSMAEPIVEKPDTAVAWLNRRVDEMRVAL